MQKIVSLLIFAILGRFSLTAQTFIESSLSMGIDQIHQSTFLMGGGIAVLDYDNDGWEDLYMTGGYMADKLYRNLGNGSFEDVSASSGISGLMWVRTFGVVAGDLNNDGFPDLVITTEKDFQDIVLKNNGNGTFSYEAQAFGIAPSEAWSTSATFGDVNNDGLLDVYSVAYVEQGGVITDSLGELIGFEHQCYENLLYINQGNFQFTESGSLYGVNDPGCALAVTFTDFDNDRDCDIFLANDFGAWVYPNRLFQNQYPAASYSEVANTVATDAQIYAMGVAVADYDHDRDLDYYVTNMGSNQFFRNDGGTFTEIGEMAGVDNDSVGMQMHTGWGCMFMDHDNDTWQGLFVANGEITTAPLLNVIYDDPNAFFVNNGDGTFSNQAQSLGLGAIVRNRGAVSFDLDKDGDLDIAVATVDNDTTVSITNLLYLNGQNSGNHFLRVKPIGVTSNRDAVGAHLRIVVGGDSWVEEVNAGSSHASSKSKIIHFGLGNSNVVDSLIIDFPSGITRILTQVNADQTLEVLEDITIGIENTSIAFQPIISYDDQGNILLSLSGSCTIDLIDASGRLLASSRLNLPNGRSQVDLLSELNTHPSGGTYLVRVRSLGFSKSLRFVVR